MLCEVSDEEEDAEYMDLAMFLHLSSLGGRAWAETRIDTKAGESPGPETVPQRNVSFVFGAKTDMVVE